MNRFVWWHRIHRHNVEKRVSSILAPYLTEIICWTCERQWKRYYL